jgi:hypothetical protein
MAYLQSQTIFVRLQEEHPESEALYLVLEVDDYFKETSAAVP